MTSAPAGVGIAPASTAVIRSPSTVIEAPSRGRSEVPSISRAFLNRMLRAMFFPRCQVFPLPEPGMRSPRQIQTAYIRKVTDLHGPANLPAAPFFARDGFQHLRAEDRNPAI